MWGLQLKPDEINGIVADFNEPGHLAPTGLFVASQKYMVIQGEPSAVIRGKKVRTYTSLIYTRHAFIVSDTLNSYLITRVISNLLSR